MTIVSNLDLLRRVPLFSRLTADQAHLVSQGVTKRRFRRGELLVEQGRKSGALYILLNGRARVVTADLKGREVIIATLRQGECIGEMSLIDNSPHSASVRAEVQTDTLVLGREDFMRCMPDTSTVGYSMLVGLVQRLRQADRKIESLALMDVYGRVAHSLIEFSQPVEEGSPEMVIRDKVSRQDLAKMVGASREMVSRVMKSLEEQGFIETRADGSVLLRERLHHLD